MYAHSHRVRARLDYRDNAMIRFLAPDGPQRRFYSGWVVGKVIVERYALKHASLVQTTLNALKFRQRFKRDIDTNAGMDGSA